MSNVLVNENSLQDIASAIREKNGTETTYKPSEMGEAIRGLSSAEQLSEYMVTIREGFYNVNLPQNTELEIKVGTKLDNPPYTQYSFYQMFYKSKGVKSIKVVTQESDTLVSLHNAFFYCDDLVSLDLTEFKLPLSAVTQFVCGCANLIEIKGQIDLTLCTSNTSAFNGCSLLESVSFKENSIHINISFSQSPKLSDESVQSIIDGLADLTGSDTQTLTFHTDVKNELSEEQRAIITSKNWTLA